MKKALIFIVGILCGDILFGGSVFADGGVIAALTRQIFCFNGQDVSLEAYSINGYNYIRLRDAAELFGINIEYDATTDTVYLGEVREEYKAPDGNAYSRIDYSSAANPEAFDDVYTRDAYNAVRQSIVDRDYIIAGNDENGYNRDYDYAHFVDPSRTMNSTGTTYRAVNSVLGVINGYYFYLLGVEPDIRELYKYPGYAICKATVHTFFAEANSATEGFVQSLKPLSDREKVKKISEYICDIVDYDVNPSFGGFNEMFTSPSPVKGNCGTYSSAFVYLCQRAGLDSIMVEDEVHSWNEVYADGMWQIVDVSNYDTARSETFLFAKEYPRADIYPERTRFAKELLAPGSTI